jgi:hypothetical protein
MRFEYAILPIFDDSRSRRDQYFSFSQPPDDFPDIVFGDVELLGDVFVGCPAPPFRFCQSVNVRDDHGFDGAECFYFQHLPDVGGDPESGAFMNGRLHGNLFNIEKGVTRLACTSFVR